MFCQCIPINQQCFAHNCTCKHSNHQLSSGSGVVMKHCLNNYIVSVPFTGLLYISLIFKENFYPWYIKVKPFHIQDFNIICLQPALEEMLIHQCIPKIYSEKIKCMKKTTLYLCSISSKESTNFYDVYTYAQLYKCADLCICNAISV